MRLDSTGKTKTAPLIERDSRCVAGCHPESELTVAALLRPSGYSVDQPYSKAAPSLGGDNEHGNKEWHATRAGELICYARHNSDPHPAGMCHEGCAITAGRRTKRSLTPNLFRVDLLLS